MGEFVRGGVAMATDVAAVAAALLGVGQVMTNVTASRFKGTTYTNTTGRTMVVFIAILASPGSGAYLYIDGAFCGEVGASTDNLRLGAVLIVPSGSTYSINLLAGVVTIESWMELR